MTDDLKVKKKDDEVVEGDDTEERIEQDFAPTPSNAPVAEDDVEDPHSSFDVVAPHEEDPHAEDVTGFGVPFGFGGDDEVDEDELEEAGAVEASDLDYI